MLVSSGTKTASTLEQTYWSTVDRYRRMLSRGKFKWNEQRKCSESAITVHTQAGDTLPGRTNVKSVMISSHSLSSSVDIVRFKLASDAGDIESKRL